MKKIIALALACMLLCACTTQPGQTTAPTTQPDQTTAPMVLDLEAIFAQMAAATQEEMTAIKPERLLDLYGIDQADCLEVYVYSYNSGMMAAEVWLIRAASPEAQARLKTLAENRLSSMGAQFQTYDAKAYALVQEAELITHGNCLCLIVAEDAAALADIYKTAAELK